MLLHNLSLVCEQVWSRTLASPAIVTSPEHCVQLFAYSVAVVES